MSQNGADISFGKSINKDYLEKRYIRKTALSLGVAAIIIALLSWLWVDIVLYIVGMLGISQIRFVEVLRNEGIEQLMQMLFSVFAFTLPFILAARAVGFNVGSVASFEKPKKGTVLPCIFIGVGFCTFANFSLNRAGAIFEQFGFGYDMTKAALPDGTVGFLIYAVVTAVIPALVEEFGCRGILLGILKPMGEGFSVVVSALLFGLVHGNFEQIPFAFLVGLVLGVVRIKTGSVWVCCLIHFINNMSSVIMTYILASADTVAANAGYLIFMAVCLILGILGFTFNEMRKPVLFRKAETVSSEKQKYIWFFTSPAIIVLIIAEIINSARYIVF